MNICLDTETTGLNPSFDEILQLSIIDSDTDEVLFYEYFKPAYTVCWEEAQALHAGTMQERLVSDDTKKHKGLLSSLFHKKEV